MKNEIKRISYLIKDKKKEIFFIKKISNKNIKILLQRVKKDIKNAYKYSLSNIISMILPDIDNLERSLQAMKNIKDFNEIKHDLKKILFSFLELFKKNNVFIINDVGKLFNPNIHQAISIAKKSNFKSNYIIEVMQNGYQLNKRLLRPAMVVVSQ
ncbi:nucleotide exchange factor GrpE [Buchnera aphidicola]|uniref:nucleotide exchange factor GrpE n=1 Tax=Buchnera aphidicola TaxID=9 RepID=UPI0031B82DAA